jgi:hypothetical protein
MKKSEGKGKRNLDYPKHTSGSKLAADIRKKANSLGDTKRENLFKRGMQIIYGAAGKAKTACPR